MVENIIIRRGGMVMNNDDFREGITGIKFLQQNVMNISEATRNNKLTEILDSFTQKEQKTRVYVIQNSKRKDASGVLCSIEHYAVLNENIEKLERDNAALLDEILALKTLLRENQPEYSFAQAIEMLDLSNEDLIDIFENSDEVNID